MDGRSLVDMRICERPALSLLEVSSRRLFFFFFSCLVDQLGDIGSRNDVIRRLYGGHPAIDRNTRVRQPFTSRILVASAFRKIGLQQASFSTCIREYYPPPIFNFVRSFSPICLGRTDVQRLTRRRPPTLVRLHSCSHHSLGTRQPVQSRLHVLRA